MLKIGSLQLASRIVLAPLERVSFVGFRALCAENGAAMTWTEMIRARSLTQHTGAWDMVDTIDPGTPTGLQLVAATGDELTQCLQVGASPRPQTPICC